MPLDRVELEIENDALTHFWLAAPWNWTVGVIDSITLSAGAQSFAVAAPPGDFLRLEKAYITNGQHLHPVQPVSILPNSPSINQIPNFVYYQTGSPTKIFFDSLVGPFNPGDVWKFYGWYKKQVPLLTASNYDTAGITGTVDSYFSIYRELVLYYAYLYGYDARAGTATVEVGPDGRRSISYTGQLGRVQAMIEELRLSENVLYQFPTPNPIIPKVR